MPSVPPTKDEVTTWVKMHKQGWLVKEIAEEVHWSPTTVSKYLKLRGIAVKKYDLGHMRLSLTEKDVTRHMYRAGVPVAEIAEHFGVSQSAIRYRLNQMGEPMDRRKPFCKHGHEYTPETTYYRPGSTARECRICRDEATKRWRAERKLVGERGSTADIGGPLAVLDRG